MSCFQAFANRLSIPRRCSRTASGNVHSWEMFLTKTGCGVLLNAISVNSYRLCLKRLHSFLVLMWSHRQLLISLQYKSTSICHNVCTHKNKSVGSDVQQMYSTRQCSIWELSLISRDGPCRVYPKSIHMAAGPLSGLNLTGSMGVMRCVQSEPVTLGELCFSTTFHFCQYSTPKKKKAGLKMFFLAEGILTISVRSGCPHFFLHSALVHM